MKNSISKSVLGIVVAAIAIMAAVLWFDHRPPSPSPAPQSTEAKAEVPAAPAATNSSPSAPVTAQDNGELPPVIPISLTNVVVDAENGTWLTNKDFLRVPHQPQMFGSVTFLMDGMIQLQGLGSQTRDRNYRTSIVLPLALTNITDNGTEIVQRGSNVASLHLLGFTRYGSGSDNDMFAEIVWHYTDGLTLKTPVQYQVHFRDWTRNPYEDPANLPYAFSKVVWTTPHPSTRGRAFRLYRTTFANPAPHRIISQLEFVSDMKSPTLALVGVTLDPLKPGQRPDLSRDLEPTDTNPAKQIQIYVQSADGQPVPQAKLQVQSEQNNGSNSPIRLSNYKTTDASGYASLSYPPENLDKLQITASQEDHASRQMIWDVKGGDTVPDSYTFKLTASIIIGGIVLDFSNNPIADAKVSLYRFWTGNDDSPDKKGDHPGFSNLSATTDSQGQWQAKGVPPEMLNHIGFNIKHPDFISASLSGISGATETQLRAGTYKTVLQRGLDVTGRVLDNANNPIAGATVWAGQRWSMDRQQTKTGDDGRFSLHNVPGGSLSFQASASGYAPDDESFTVAPDMPEIVFHLGPGKSIHGVVQDGNGSPIPGVRVSLDSMGNQTYDFEATTDDSGHFTWDSAPSEPMQFSFLKEGYASKRNVALPPDKDNVVTLNPPRQLQGQVVDADSGQPVTKFTVRTGKRQDANSDNIYGIIQDHDFTTQDGTFTLSLDEDDDNAVRVTSDDYATKVESFSDAQNGVIQMTIQMKSSPSLQGVVLAPDGTPAPGVSVAVAKPGAYGSGSVQLQGTHLTSWDNGSKVVITDANGQFTLPSLPATGGFVVAVGEQGFASAPVDQVRASPSLTLQAFGRIEGTLNIGGQPAAGKELYFNQPSTGLQTDFNSYKTTTDDQGKFTFEQLPPGDGTIVRLVQMVPNMWTHSDKTDVTVKSGETTQVTLGDNGAVITGTVRLETQPTNGVSVVYEGHISGQSPQAPAFNSPAEAQAYYQSPEWQAIAAKIKQYSFAVNPNGTFTADDIAPGTYSVNVQALKGGSQPWSHPTIASGNTTLTVPDSFDPASPINIGEIILKPSPSPSN